MPSSKQLQHVDIYTDGACSPNPGRGGWGSLLISRSHAKRREISGSESETTNNRMELTAAIEALKALKQPCEVALYTDSNYLRNAFEENWLESWQKKHWKMFRLKALSVSRCRRWIRSKINGRSNGRRSAIRRLKQDRWTCLHRLNL